MIAAGHSHMFGTWWGWGLLGLLWALLITAIIIAAFVVLIRIAVRSTSDRRTGGPALKVLEERYARGEISREEFLERRSVLLGQAAPPPTPPQPPEPSPPPPAAPPPSA